MIKFNCNICAHDVQMILIINDEALMKNLFKSTLITINLFFFLLQIFYNFSSVSWKSRCISLFLSFKKEKRTFSSSTTASKARLASVRSEFCASDGNLNVRSYSASRGERNSDRKFFNPENFPGRQFIVLLVVSKESIDDERSNEQFEDLCRV